MTFSQSHPLHCNHNASVYPMNPFRRLVTLGNNARVWFWNWRLTEREEMGKRRSEGDMQSDTWYWCRVLSNPPPGCLWRLWQSASTQTEPFRLDGNVFCWWMNNVVTTETVHEHYRKTAKTPSMLCYARWNDSLLQIRPWHDEFQRIVNDCMSYILGTLSSDWVRPFMMRSGPPV